MSWIGDAVSFSTEAAGFLTAAIHLAYGSYGTTFRAVFEKKARCKGRMSQLIKIRTSHGLGVSYHPGWDFIVGLRGWDTELAKSAERWWAGTTTDIRGASLRRQLVVMEGFTDVRAVIDTQ